MNVQLIPVEFNHLEEILLSFPCLHALWSKENFSFFSQLLYHVHEDKTHQ